ncbi:MAG: single-stranded DNA-binding protein [Negativicutes bacterium]|nr:single-stranded DNA-binding protein [Negativicutes bacterium]
MNKVILVGRLTQDPEIRYTQTGKAVASFTVAVNRFVSQGRSEADFIPVVVWDKLAEVCGNNLTKGQRVLVEGRLQIRSYEGNDGQKRRVAEVVAQNIEFLERKQAAEGGGGNKDFNVNTFGPDVFPEEEIPF